MFVALKGEKTLVRVALLVAFKFLKSRETSEKAGQSCGIIWIKKNMLTS